jgi:hypothetical protein
MWRGLEAKIREVTDSFLKGLEIARHELKMQLAEVEAQGACEFSEYSTVEAWTKHRSYQRMGSVQAWHRPQNLTDRLHGPCFNTSSKPWWNTMAGHLATKLHI